jgi:predicted SAM-dependent methyltransferase
MKLNLFCGKNIKENFINIDKYNFGQEIILDLEKDKLPFADESIDFILSYHGIEHIENLVFLMNEIWRTLKISGTFEIISPCYPSERCFQDPTHKKVITTKTFLYFSDDNFIRYIPEFKGKFKILKQENLENNDLHIILEKNAR